MGSSPHCVPFFFPLAPLIKNNLSSTNRYLAVNPQRRSMCRGSLLLVVISFSICWCLSLPDCPESYLGWDLGASKWTLFWASGSLIWAFPSSIPSASEQVLLLLLEWWNLFQSLNFSSIHFCSTNDSSQRPYTFISVFILTHFIIFLVYYEWKIPSTIF